MGAQLVGRAFAALARDPEQLSPNARLVLLFMALSALDGDARPSYWRDRESTAIAIGRMVPEEVEPEHSDYVEVTRQRQSVHRMVQRAIAELIDRGYIRRQRRGQRGQLARFELTIPSVVVSEQRVHPENELAVHPETNSEYVRSELGVLTEEPLRNQEEQHRGVTPPRARTSRAPVESRGAA